MITCTTCQELIAEKFCGLLDHAAKQCLEEHLGTCANCRAEHDTLAAALSMVDQAGPLTGPVAVDPWPDLQRALAQQQRQRLLRWAIPLTALAAALVLVLLLVPSAAPPQPDLALIPDGQPVLPPTNPVSTVLVEQPVIEKQAPKPAPAMPAPEQLPQPLPIEPAPEKTQVGQTAPEPPQAEQDSNRVASYWRRARPLLMAMANRELEGEPLSNKVLAKESALASRLAHDAEALQTELGERLAPEHQRMLEDSQRLFRQLAKIDPDHYLAQAAAVQDHVVDQSLLFRIALFQLRHNATGKS